MFLSAILLAACSTAVRSGDLGATSPTPAEINAAAEQTAEVDEDELPETAPETTTVVEPRINPRVEVPEDLRVNWLLPFDGIRPVYDPEFASAAEAPLADDELVIGISLEGKAKAYPITVLRFREMVNDELAGWPILVTW